MKMSNCDWMSKLPDDLHDVPLFKLAIPGSHDSMSYDLDVNSSIAEPERLKRLSRIYCARTAVLRWAVTQEGTITEQLDAGVRYFDLRIARKPNDRHPSRLYFYHGLYTRTDVETVLSVVNEWANTHPREILILALSHFKELEDKLHLHLINFIRTLFGSRLFLNTEIPTLRKCWATGRNILVSYDYPAKPHIQLWRKIPYFYGDSMDLTKVESKLCHMLEKSRPSNCFFVCGLNLTLPEDVKILRYMLRLCDNLPAVIQRSLPRLLAWLRVQAAKTPVNIVASDLVTHGDFVQTVVRLNTKE